MNIKNYLESTYLKTNDQSGISENETIEIVKKTILEAIKNNFKVVMIRPNRVELAKEMIQKANSKVAVGTVISFPEGTNSIEEKIEEATKAIHTGADDLDFVCNFEAFKKNEISVVKKEIYLGTKLAIENNKTIKWIIEVAALNQTEIIRLTTMIKNVVLSNFKEENYSSIFIKSSTGFYQTSNNLPNGATKETIIAMLENSFPLAIKASGGIQNYKQAMKMIRLGVKRIGTSNAKAILDGRDSKNRLLKKL